MKIGVIMGSDSDLKKVAPALAVWDEFAVPYEVDIISAHRTPELAAEYAATAEDRGIEVIVAAAGLAAHLPGVLAAKTVLPVIGIPIGTGALQGIDALYSIVQMPPGIPVATVGVDNAVNAAYLAVEILALKDVNLRDRLKNYRSSLEQKVRTKNEKLRQDGITGFLK